MKVTILTPVSQLFEGEAKSVKAPGIDGGLEILDSTNYFRTRQRNCFYYGCQRSKTQI